MITSPEVEAAGTFLRTLGKLMIDTLYHYRGMDYLLHEFVVMPELTCF